MLRLWTAYQARFMKDEDGASMVEYALLVALIAVVVIAAAYCFTIRDTYTLGTDGGPDWNEARERILPAVSGGHCNASASFSDGVIQGRVCRGLLLSE